MVDKLLHFMEVPYNLDLKIYKDFIEKLLNLNQIEKLLLIYLMSDLNEDG